MEVFEIDLLKIFSSTETPFALLFIALFFYVIRTNRAREKRLTDLIDGKLTTIHNEMQILIKVWQILLEKEIKKRNEEET
jgi:hypothetical protein